MPWAWLDDGFYDHEKILAISNDAHAVWTSGIAYSNRKLTDGHLTTAQADYLCRLRRAPDSVVAELVTARLWERADDGFEIHDFHDYSKDTAVVLADREELSRVRAEAGRSGGVRSGQMRREANAKQTKQNRSKIGHDSLETAVDSGPTLSEPQNGEFGVRNEANEAKSKQNASKQQANAKPGTGTGTGVNSVESADSTAALPRAPLTAIRDFSERLRDGQNGPAVIADAILAVYGEPCAPGDFARIGVSAKACGGYGQLLGLVYELAPTWKGLDDLIDYIQATANDRAKRRRNGRSAPVLIRPAPRDSTPDELAAALAEDQARRDRLKSDAPPLRAWAT